MRKQHIVKVQTSLASSTGAQSVLIYNEDKSIMDQFDMTGQDFVALKRKMKGEPKQFFYSHINAKQNLVLDGLAPWQDW